MRVCVLPVPWLRLRTTFSRRHAIQLAHSRTPPVPPQPSFPLDPALAALRNFTRLQPERTSYARLLAWLAQTRALNMALNHAIPMDTSSPRTKAALKAAAPVEASTREEAMAAPRRTSYDKDFSRRSFIMTMAT